MKDNQVLLYLLVRNIHLRNFLTQGVDFKKINHQIVIYPQVVHPRVCKNLNFDGWKLFEKLRSFFEEYAGRSVGNNIGFVKVVHYKILSRFSPVLYVVTEKNA